MTDQTRADVLAVFDAVEAEPSAAFTESLLGRLREELDAPAEPLVVSLTVTPGVSRPGRGRRRLAALVAAGTVAVAGLVAAVAISVVVSGDSASRQGDAAAAGPPPVELAWAGPGERGWPVPSADATVLDEVVVGRGGRMSGPYAVAHGEDEGLWLTVGGAEGAWLAVRLDPGTGEVLAEVPVPGGPPLVQSEHGLAVAGGNVWVPVPGPDGGLFRIDAASGESGLVPIDGGVAGSAAVAGDGSVWAAAAGRLYRLSVDDAEVVATAVLPEMGDAREEGSQSTELAYDGSTLWVDVGDDGRRHLIGLDPDTLRRRSHALLPDVGDTSSPFDIVTAGGRVVVACLGPGNVLVIDPEGPSMVASRFASTDALSADGDRVWASSSDQPPAGRTDGAPPGTLVAVDPATGAVQAAIGVPSGVHEVVPVGDGTYWAASPWTGTMVRLRLP
jgi:DNA-binding beta-propeller fold protein YncE